MFICKLKPRCSQFLGAMILAAVGVCGAVSGVRGADTFPATAETSVVYDSVGTPLAPISASVVMANREADRTLNLLARVEVQPNEVLEFYEPSPGYIFITGAGAPIGRVRVTSEDLAGKSPEEMWQLVAPPEAMPEALRQALERAQQRREQAAAGESARPSPRPATMGERAGPQSAHQDAGLASTMGTTSLTAGWCDTGYFQNGYGACANHAFEVCLDNWWNGAYAYHHEAEYAYTNVCPATGSVILEVQSDVGGGIWTVQQNTYRWWSVSNSLCDSFNNWSDCPYARADVKQASGDRFHFRFLVDE